MVIYLQREWMTNTVRIITFQNTTTGLIEAFIARRVSPASPWGPFIKAEKVC